jgi:hypothetical protein
MIPTMMETNAENKDLLENYLGLLSGLSKEYKMKVIESLNYEIEKGSNSGNEWIDKLYGSFVSEKSAENIITEIKSDRRFTREITGF